MTIDSASWETVCGHNSGAFFHRDDLVDGHVGQSIDLAARPGDFQGFDLRALAQTEVNSRIAGRHVAHAAFGLLDVHEAFGSQLQRSADAVAIRFGADQQNFQPVIRVAAVVAQEFRIIAAIVDDDVDVAVVVEISGSKAAANDGTHEIWAERLGNFLELAFAQVAKHQQRLFVSDLAVIELHVVEHGAVQLQNVGPAVVVVIQKFHRNAAQQDGFVADAGAKGIVVEGSVSDCCGKDDSIRNRDE